MERIKNDSGLGVERLIEERYAEVKRKQDHLRINVAQDQTI